MSAEVQKINKIQYFAKLPENLCSQQFARYRRNPRFGVGKRVGKDRGGRWRNSTLESPHDPDQT
jgi:hypothetical protein